MDKNSLAHTRWECKYHIVFAPKYRRKIIYNKIKADVAHILSELCKRKGIEIIEALTKPYQIPILRQDKTIHKLSDKENCFVIGVVKKYRDTLRADKSHIVLVNPSNMGNMGTIIRTAIGFGIKDMAIISPGVDVFHPKTIRASMGALFRINFQYFNSFEDYEAAYPTHEIFCFMLKFVFFGFIFAPKFFDITK